MIIEPLVKALACGEAVAFVGSGASISSGLPDWRTFLLELLEYAESLHGRGMDSVKDGWQRTRQLLSAGHALPAIDHDSVISTVFLQANANINKDYIYLKDVAEAKANLEASGYPHRVHRSR